MRRLRLITVTIALALSIGAPPAQAAEKGEKPPTRMKVPPLSRAGLRGPLAPSAAARPPPAPAGLGAPALRPLGEQGVSGGRLTGQSFIGLRATVDPAPQCRADCARARYFCATGSEDAGCNDRWGQCVLSCRSAGRP